VSRRKNKNITLSPRQGYDAEDYYYENGFMVFTEAYHLKRGYCCKNGCRHCPYGFKKN
jgi:hypothetical protein